MNEKQFPNIQNNNTKPTPDEMQISSESDQEQDSSLRTLRIKTLNDTFRQTFVGGAVVMTLGILCLPKEDQEEVLTQVRQFKDFTEDNDPHGEHDFGIIRHKGETIYWKIDYYDRQRLYGSEDPANPSITSRVLTIYLASEH